jgi:hypothetical protein
MTSRMMGQFAPVTGAGSVAAPGLRLVWMGVTTSCNIVWDKVASSNTQLGLCHRKHAVT